ncbi:MAG: DUF192 domain-containing protein [Chloroflexota bacterium]
MARVVNETKGTVVAEHVGHARSFWHRFRGLMLQSGLESDAGLFIEPSGSIHTAFMRFPIDAVFVDKGKRVVKVTTVKPWRASVSKGHSVLELPAGRAAEIGVEAGDQLSIEPMNAGQTSGDVR